MQNIRYFFILLGIIGVTSCTSPGKDVLPQDKGASMVQVYQQETQSNYPEPAYDGQEDDIKEEPQEPISTRSHETMQNPYTKVPIREVYSVRETVGDAGDYYKPVENIRMRIFIYPHRVYNEGEESIVPSYYTYFPLYSHQHYYLPNEAV